MTYRSSGYRYESATELTEFPFPVLWRGRTELTEGPERYENAVVPVPRVLWHGRAEFTEVPGTGMNVINNLRKFRVKV